MTYLVTGATGFLGRRLVEMLLADGHSVNYLARKLDRSMNARAAFHHWESRKQRSRRLPPFHDAMPLFTWQVNRSLSDGLMK